MRSTIERKETMKVFFLCTAMLVTSVPAFTSPSIRPSPRSYQHVSRSTQMSAAMRVSLPSNPLRKLPWNAAKERDREARRLKQEGAKLYRELGVPEDASFEEIQEATSVLLIRYEDDIKQRVKIEITKDKIMQLRLNQRLGGMAKANKEATAASYLRDDADKFDNEKNKKEFKAPSWTKGMIVKPNEKWRDTCIIFFGSICTVGILSPGMAAGLQIFAFILAFGFMAQRGTPEAEPGAGPRERVGGHTGMAFVLSFATYIFSAALATTFTRSIPAIWDNKICSGVQNLIVSGALGLATAYLQPYKKK